MIEIVSISGLIVVCVMYCCLCDVLLIVVIEGICSARLAVVCVMY